MAAKPFKETGVGKFLTSKGFGKVLEIAGSVIPGAKILSEVKDLVVGSDEYKALTPADQELFLRLHQAEMDELDKRMADIANARQREIEIARTGKKDWMMMITGLVGLLAFLFLVITTVFFKIPDSNRDLFNILLGNVMGVALSIFTYYYGSSKGSRDKTDIFKSQIE